MINFNLINSHSLEFYSGMYVSLVGASFPDQDANLILRIGSANYCARPEAGKEPLNLAGVIITCARFDCGTSLLLEGEPFQEALKMLNRLVSDLASSVKIYEIARLGNEEFVNFDEYRICGSTQLYRFTTRVGPPDPNGEPVLTNIVDFEKWKAQIPWILCFLQQGAAFVNKLK